MVFFSLFVCIFMSINQVYISIEFGLPAIFFTRFSAPKQYKMSNISNSFDL